MSLPWPLIEQTAKEFGVDPKLVAAFCIVESGGNPWAIRYEPTWRYLLNVKKWAYLLHISLDTAIVSQKISWGIMQVLGSVALEDGYRGDLPMLCRVDVGLRFGVIHLKKCIVKFPGDIRHAIAAYNGGPGVRYLPDGKFKNDDYVDKIMLAWSEQQRERGL